MDEYLPPIKKIEFFDKGRIIFIRMGIGIQVFLVDHNDSLQRLPMARLDRLSISTGEKVCNNTLGNVCVVLWYFCRLQGDRCFP